MITVVGNLIELEDVTGQAANLTIAVLTVECGTIMAQVHAAKRLTEERMITAQKIEKSNKKVWQERCDCVLHLYFS